MPSRDLTHDPAPQRSCEQIATGIISAERHDAPLSLSFHSELTPEGEQLVIPGCERNRSPRLRQLDLFG